MSADNNGSIQRVERKHFRAVAASLALAFAEDPVMLYIFPEPHNRHARIAAMFRLALKTYARDGLVESFTEGCAAAIWQPPNPDKPSFLEVFLNGLEAVVKLRSAIQRGGRVESAMARAKPAQPYWYLAVLGTEPAHRGPWLQGHSRARRLMMSVLQRCDNDRSPAYLESSNADNLSFYKSFGFTITEEISLPDGPSLWGMWREPQ